MIRKPSNSLEKKINMMKVNLRSLKPWISKKLVSYVGTEDDVLIEFIFSQLEEKTPDPILMQQNMAGFINAKNARNFVQELWDLLDTASESANGIPPQVIGLKNDDNRQTYVELQPSENMFLKQMEIKRLISKIISKDDNQSVSNVVVTSNESEMFTTITTNISNPSKSIDTINSQQSNETNVNVLPVNQITNSPLNTLNSNSSSFQSDVYSFDNQTNNRLLTGNLNNNLPLNAGSIITQPLAVTSVASIAEPDKQTTSLESKSGEKSVATPAKQTLPFEAKTTEVIDIYKPPLTVPKIFPGRDAFGRNVFKARRSSSSGSRSRSRSRYRQRKRSRSRTYRSRLRRRSGSRSVSRSRSRPRMRSRSASFVRHRRKKLRSRSVSSKSRSSYSSSSRSHSYKRKKSRSLSYYAKAKNRKQRFRESRSGSNARRYKDTYERNENVSYVSYEYDAAMYQSQIPVPPYSQYPYAYSTGVAMPPAPPHLAYYPPPVNLQDTAHLHPRRTKAYSPFEGAGDVPLPYYAARYEETYREVPLVDFYTNSNAVYSLPSHIEAYPTKSRTGNYHTKDSPIEEFKKRRDKSPGKPQSRKKRNYRSAKKSTSRSKKYVKARSLSDSQSGSETGSSQSASDSRSEAREINLKSRSRSTVASKTGSSESVRSLSNKSRSRQPSLDNNPKSRSESDVESHEVMKGYLRSASRSESYISGRITDSEISNMLEGRVVQNMLEPESRDFNGSKNKIVNESAMNKRSFKKMTKIRARSYSHSSSSSGQSPSLDKRDKKRSSRGSKKQQKVLDRRIYKSKETVAKRDEHKLDHREIKEVDISYKKNYRVSKIKTDKCDVESDTVVKTKLTSVNDAANDLQTQNMTLQMNKSNLTKTSLPVKKFTTMSFKTISKPLKPKISCFEGEGDGKANSSSSDSNPTNKKEQKVNSTDEIDDDPSLNNKKLRNSRNRLTKRDCSDETDATQRNKNHKTKNKLKQLSDRSDKFEDVEKQPLNAGVESRRRPITSKLKSLQSWTDNESSSQSDSRSQSRSTNEAQRISNKGLNIRPDKSRVGTSKIDLKSRSISRSKSRSSVSTSNSSKGSRNLSKLLSNKNESVKDIKEFKPDKTSLSSGESSGEISLSEEDMEGQPILSLGRFATIKDVINQKSHDNFNKESIRKERMSIEREIETKYEKDFKICGKDAEIKNGSKNNIDSKTMDPTKLKKDSKLMSQSLGKLQEPMFEQERSNKDAELVQSESGLTKENNNLDKDEQLKYGNENNSIYVSKQKKIKSNASQLDEKVKTPPLLGVKTNLDNLNDFKTTNEKSTKISTHKLVDNRSSESEEDMISDKKSLVDNSSSLDVSPCVDWSPSDNMPEIIKTNKVKDFPLKRQLIPADLQIRKDFSVEKRDAKLINKAEKKKLEPVIRSPSNWSNSPKSPNHLNLSASRWSESKSKSRTRSRSVSVNKKVTNNSPIEDEIEFKSSDEDKKISSNLSEKSYSKSLSDSRIRSVSHDKKFNISQKKFKNDNSEDYKKILKNKNIKKDLLSQNKKIKDISVNKSSGSDDDDNDDNDDKDVHSPIKAKPKQKNKANKTKSVKREVDKKITKKFKKETSSIDSNEESNQSSNEESSESNSQSSSSSDSEPDKARKNKKIKPVNKKPLAKKRKTESAKGNKSKKSKEEISSSESSSVSVQEKSVAHKRQTNKKSSTRKDKEKRVKPKKGDKNEKYSKLRIQNKKRKRKSSSSSSSSSSSDSESSAVRSRELKRRKKRQPSSSEESSDSSSSSSPSQSRRKNRTKYRPSSRTKYRPRYRSRSRPRHRDRSRSNRRAYSRSKYDRESSRANPKMQNQLSYSTSHSSNSD